MRTRPGTAVRRKTAQLPRTDSPSSAARIALTAFITALFFVSIRTLFPLAYGWAEEIGKIDAGVYVSLVFLAPLLVWPCTRYFGGRLTLAASATTLAGAVLWMHLAGPTLPIAIVATTSALVALTVVHRTSEADVGSRRSIVVGIAVGVTMDAGIRAALQTWDVTWQDAAAARLAIGVLLVGLLSAAALAIRTAVDDGDRPALIGTGIAVLAYLGLQVGFLQSLAFASSSTGFAMEWGAAIVLAGSALAVVVAAKAPIDGSRMQLAVAGLLVVVASYGFRSVTGIVAGIALTLVPSAAAWLLARAVTGATGAVRRSAGSDAIGFALGGLVLILTSLLYVLHYDYPLPVPNEVLPALSAAILGIVAMRRPATPEHLRTSSDWRWVAVPLALLLIVPASLAGTRADVNVPLVTDRSVRVLTFNIHGAVGRSGRLDPEAIARVIEQENADVVTLYEVSRGWALSGMTDLGEWMARRLRMASVWVPAADNQFGSMLLSRLPVTSERVVGLPKGDGTMERSALIASVDVEGTEVEFLAPHFAHKEGAEADATRDAQLVAMLRAWDTPPLLARFGLNGGRIEHGPTVVIGDLNAQPWFPLIDKLKSAGFHPALNDEACEIKTSNENCVDWVFATNDIRFSDLRVTRTDLSDHNVVAVTITI